MSLPDLRAYCWAGIAICPARLAKGQYLPHHRQQRGLRVCCVNYGPLLGCVPHNLGGLTTSGAPARGFARSTHCWYLPAWVDMSSSSQAGWAGCRGIGIVYIYLLYVCMSNIFAFASILGDRSSSLLAKAHWYTRVVMMFVCASCADGIRWHGAGVGVVTCT